MASDGRLLFLWCWTVEGVRIPFGGGLIRRRRRKENAAAPTKFLFLSLEMGLKYAAVTCPLQSACGAPAGALKPRTNNNNVNSSNAVFKKRVEIKKGEKKKIKNERKRQAQRKKTGRGTQFANCVSNSPHLETTALVHFIYLNMK